MTDGWVEYLTGPWGLPFAFAAGVLSFLSPCCLPLVPPYLAHLTGTVAGSPDAPPRRTTVTHAAVFILGFTAVFTFIGTSVGLIGALVSQDSSYVVRDQLPVLAKIAGVFLIIMGLNLAGVIRLPLLYRTYTLESISPVPVPAAAMAASAGGSATATWTSGAGGGGASSYIKSVGVGAAFAVGWTPCIGPVLGTILTLSAATGDVARGGYLLFVYSLGLGLPFMITSLAVVPIMRVLRRYSWLLPWVEVTLGVFVIIVGSLIFLDELTIFNKYFDFFGLSEI